MTSFERTAIGLLTLLIIVSAMWWVKRDQLRYRKLILATTVLTFVLVVLGAFVRLSDAGLGCPDWPGCYGNLAPHLSASDIQSAQVDNPNGPVSMEKAWKEMVHRYLAMLVGSLIAAIMFLARWNRIFFQQSPLLATVTAITVIIQAALGALTVTLLLKPAIVTGHLIGGMTTLALLVWLLLRNTKIYTKGTEGNAPESLALISFSAIALLVVIVQIILGGWVSTNYAALACPDLPQCNQQWIPDDLKFSDAFHIVRPLGYTADGALLSITGLRAIHWVHRVGALMVILVLSGFAIALWRRDKWRREALTIAALLLLQLSLGLANVLWSLPLPIAVAHNGGAALLLCAMVWINFRVRYVR